MNELFESVRDLAPLLFFASCQRCLDEGQTVLALGRVQGVDEDGDSYHLDLCLSHLTEFEESYQPTLMGGYEVQSV